MLGPGRGQRSGSQARVRVRGRGLVSRARFGVTGKVRSWGGSEDWGRRLRSGQRSEPGIQGRGLRRGPGSGVEGWGPDGGEGSEGESQAGPGLAEQPGFWGRQRTPQDRAAAATAERALTSPPASCRRQLGASSPSPPRQSFAPSKVSASPARIPCGRQTRRQGFGFPGSRNEVRRLGFECSAPCLFLLGKGTQYRKLVPRRPLHQSPFKFPF